MARGGLLAFTANQNQPPSAHENLPPQASASTAAPAAIALDDLRVPPGNRLEALGGDRLGQHSIRINDQWRVCFAWTGGGADSVEIVDYP